MKSRTLWIVALMAITVIGFLSWTRNGQSAAKIQWEYYTESPNSNPAHLSAERLNKLGLEGWELVEVSKIETLTQQYIFKRQK